MCLFFDRTKRGTLNQANNEIGDRFSPKGEWNALEMDYSSARSFTMTLAHRAVGDIRRGGFRQLRNYVDLCAMLAHKPRQKRFFEFAQTALERTDSCYYSLIQRLLDTVDEDRICTVGVNTAFSGMIYGAAQQVQCAQKTGCEAALVTAARCGDPKLVRAVEQAQAQYRYIWVLDGAAMHDPAKAAPAAAAFPESVFAILADPVDLDAGTVRALAACENVVVLPLLQGPEVTAEVSAAVRLLVRNRMFYGLAVLVGEKDVETALGPDWLGCLAQETLFCLYARRPGMSNTASRHLYRGVVDSRMETGMPVLLLDWDQDVKTIGRALYSGEAFMRIASLLEDGEEFPLRIRD